ncbi:MAG: nucleotide exchange factor GrpE [Clostridia bacterium]|nr:nucleotide exchange factor GrpE [Clostridia bacterium]
MKRKFGKKADQDKEPLEEGAPQDAPEAEQPAEEAEEMEGVADLKPLLEASRQKAEEYLNLAQRVQADFDNFRRRNQSVRADAYEEGAKDFIKTLLPVVDNLERALQSESADETLKTGVEMVLKQLLETLEKRGVTVIDRLGEPFDPNLENAVLQGTPEDGEKGTVCQVLQKGYQMSGSVLRTAMVKVVPE